MLTILYEDKEILVAVKPAGMESQSSRRLEPDMVSEIRKTMKESTKDSTTPVDIYVGVIHRLDKPVDGVMVYGKTKEAAAALSRQIQTGQMGKKYYAVLCGKPVKNAGSYVDYLLKTGKSGEVLLVDKGSREAKRSELSYRVLGTLTADAGTMEPQREAKMEMEPQKKARMELVRERQMAEDCSRELSLVEIELLTGRYHQIRVQFAGRGTPLWGDARYHPLWGGTLPGKTPSNDGMPAAVSLPRIRPNQDSLALSAVYLSFLHPRTGKKMEFSMKPGKPIFKHFL